MKLLSEHQKQALIGRESNLPIRTILDCIQTYENLSLDDFPNLSEDRKKYIENMIGPKVHQEWVKIRLNAPSLHLIRMILQYIYRWEDSLPRGNHVDEAKKFLCDVIQTLLEKNDQKCKSEILLIFIGFEDWKYQNHLEQAIHSLKYHGDVFIREEDLFIELCLFIMSLHASSQKESLIESLITWSKYSMAISKCWPCLPMDPLTKFEENAIYQKRICIASNYIHDYPDSIFCKGAYAIIYDDLDDLDLRYLKSKDILGLIHQYKEGDEELRHLFMSFFMNKLRVNDHEGLMTFLYQDSDHLNHDFMKDNIGAIDHDFHPKTIVINIGTQHCGKTSLIMGLSNTHVEGYHIHWDDSFDELALKYLENGIYPDYNGPNYSILTAHINKGRKETHLQFLDCNFHIFERQLLEGADSIEQETLKILKNKDSKVINILIDPVNQEKYNWGRRDHWSQSQIIMATLQSMDVFGLWRSVKKINVIITKYDLIQFKMEMTPLILSDKKNGYQLDCSQMEENIRDSYRGVWGELEHICRIWGIKAELLYYSIGQPILADRYNYSDDLANVIMHSILSDIPFSNKGIIRYFSNFIHH